MEIEQALQEKAAVQVGHCLKHERSAVCRTLAYLVLREIEGCCYESIADILELPIGTVRSRLHRARLQLREQLGEILQEKLAE